MDIASTNMSERTITLCETRVRGDDFVEDKRFEILDQRFPEKGVLLPNCQDNQEPRL